MAWLILVVIFWKPLYHFGFWAKSKFKDTVEKTALSDWFYHLVELVKP